MKSRDMAKIGHMILNNGKYKGKQIVSEEWIAESTKTHISGKSHPIVSGYGYQWYCDETTINKAFHFFPQRPPPRRDGGDKN